MIKITSHKINKWKKSNKKIKEFKKKKKFYKFKLKCN